MFLVNGEASEHLALADRALHYGDGLFETLAVKNGQVLAFKQHLERLHRDCEKMQLSAPDAALLQEESLQLCRDKQKAVLKWIISAGPGGRGYQRAQDNNPTRIVATYDWPQYPDSVMQSGIDVSICQGRLAIQSMLPGVKHLNRLEQVMLRQELTQRQQLEGIVLDTNDNVVEGTMSNLFIVKDGALYTPELSHCGICGVIRNIILLKARDWQWQAYCSNITVDTLMAADEVFFCNSIIGIWPVRSINGQTYRLGPCSAEIRDRLIQADIVTE